MDMKLTTKHDGHHIRWTFGACYSLERQATGKIPQVHLQRCCLDVGIHTLTCVNTKNPAGWENSYIEIQGIKYCHDFIGYKAMREIKIIGR